MSEQQQTLTIQQALDLAVQHHNAGRLPKAETIYQQILQSNPNQPIALHLLGVIAHEVGKTDTAVDLITKALAIEPDYAGAHNNLGNALQDLGRLDEAVASYHKALAVKPDFAEAHYNLGVVFKELGQLDEAVASYGKALAIKPNHVKAHYNLGLALQDLGRLDEAVASYHKALAVKPDFAEAHYNLGNALKELGKPEDAVASYRKALSIKPNYSKAHNNLGTALQKLEKLDEAVASYNNTLAIKPNYADAHNNLGTALQKLGKLNEAVASYHKALAIKPNYAEAHSNLGLALQDLGRLDEAVASYHKALAVKPDYADAHNNLGNAFKGLGRLDEAVASYHKALAIKSDFAEAHHNLGMAQLLKGDFQNGWENYNCRWSCEAFAPTKKEYDKPLWQGQTIYGKRLLVWEEQGLGERILFASMIPDLIELGADIILGCDKRLIPLFSRSFPTISCANIDDLDIENAENMKFDLHAPLGNVGLWLRADFASFPTRPPYLVADSQQRQTLRKCYIERGNDFLVGIAWCSKSSAYGLWKSMTLHELRPLLEVPGITFIDLQYGDTSEEREAFTAETGIEIFHDDSIDQMVDLDSFASQVAAMDMVVTISNATAHMAGALGVPTLLMLGMVPLWYWLLDRDDIPWYPSLRLIRQHERGDWQGVVERTRNELVACIGNS